MRLSLNSALGTEKGFQTFRLATESQSFYREPNTLSALLPEIVTSCLRFVSDGDWRVVLKLQTVCRHWANLCGSLFSEIAISEACSTRSVPLVLKNDQISRLWDPALAKAFIAFNWRVRTQLTLSSRSSNLHLDKSSAQKPDSRLLEYIRTRMDGNRLPAEARFELYCALYYQLLAPRDVGLLSFETAYVNLYRLTSLFNLSTVRGGWYVGIVRSHNRLSGLRLKARTDPTQAQIDDIGVGFMYLGYMREMVLGYLSRNNIDWREIEQHYLECVFTPELIAKVRPHVEIGGGTVIAKWNAIVQNYYHERKNKV